MNILLIGMRGAGKSTLGQAAARELGLPFVEIDDLTRARFNHLPVSTIWKLHGEPAWRGEEARQLQIALARRDSLIALGGGGVVSPGSQAAIRRARHDDVLRVVFLACQPDVLAQRLADAPGDRPSLTGHRLHDEVRDVLAARAGMYQELADRTIDTASGTPADRVRHLVETVRSWLTGRPGACCS